MQLTDILDLEDHGPDTFVGAGPRYPWGGLYGGQIVAQALRAAAATVAAGFDVHSLRAYFIRRGDHSEPVRYEVDRIRDGRSFCTRRVVARQAVGAILNLEASFQAAERSDDIETVSLPAGLPAPDELEPSSWSPVFERRFVPPSRIALGERSGVGRAAAWLRVLDELDGDQLLHRAALAYLSDDLPTDAVVRAHPLATEPEEVLHQVLFTASLDHTIWFHRPMRADRWHLHDFTCHTFVGGRGLAIGHVFTEDGTHAATVAQEVLLRDSRERTT
ncbi:acyl-CoA thioesterase [Rhabdothermincola sp.]|uniref:acyl-CoA thioesterase n=1 Tax=Rhabdothermincola sp. TaxID=2820405 RepID=UPI002FE23A04